MVAKPTSQDVCTGDNDEEYVADDEGKVDKIIPPVAIAIVVKEPSKNEVAEEAYDDKDDTDRDVNKA